MFADIRCQEFLMALQGGAMSSDVKASAAKNPLLGDVLVVLAQLLAATQFIVEEKYLAK